MKLTRKFGTYYLEVKGESSIGSFNNKVPEKVVFKVPADKVRLLKEGLKDKDWGVDTTNEYYEDVMCLKKSPYFMPALYEIFTDKRTELYSIQNIKSGKMVYEQSAEMEK